MKEITTAEFETEVLQADKVVLDFYSNECPPCEALAPKFESLAAIYGSDIRFVKVFRQKNLKNIIVMFLHAVQRRHAKQYQH